MLRTTPSTSSLLSTSSATVVVRPASELQWRHAVLPQQGIYGGRHLVYAPVKQPAAPPSLVAPPAPSGPATPAPAAPVATEAKIEAGTRVVVTKRFKSNTLDDKVMLQEGQRGTVDRLDGEGDALIKFDGLRRKEWVVTRNFDKLQVVDEHSGAEEEPERPADRGSTGRRSRAASLPPASVASQLPQSQQVAASTPTGLTRKQMVQAQMNSLQVQASVIDMHQEILQSHVDKLAAMQQQIVDSKSLTLQHISVLRGGLSKPLGPWIPNQAGTQALAEERCGSTTTSSTSAGSNSLVHEESEIQEGASIEVIQGFKSNSKDDKVELQPGQKGIVSRLDHDGDALIKFYDHKDKEWVARRNFGKLRVLSKTDQVQVHEVGHSAVVCRC